MSTGAFQTTQFGSQLTAVPVAIRHIQLHTHSGGIYTSFAGEYEITTGHRMKLDKRAVFLSNSSMSSDVKKYLSKMAKAGGEPASGEILYEVNKAINDPNYELPVPLAPLSVTPVPVPGSAAKQFLVKPPPDIGAGVFDLKYAGGSQETAKKAASEMGLQPGDFIEGLKGTRYIIAQGANGNLLYCKVDPHTKQIDFNKVFPVSSEPFYHLEGHVAIPEPKTGGDTFQGWSPADYAGHVEDKPGAKKVSAFKAGEMFLFNGEAWKVETPYAGGNAPVVVSMNTGKKGYAEAGAKAAPLVPKKGYVPSAPTPEAAVDTETPKTYAVGDKVAVNSPGLISHGEVTEVLDGGNAYKVWTPAHPGGLQLNKMYVSDPSEMPGVKKGEYEPGDKFQFDGIGPYTISSVLKDGTVRAKLSGGKVQKFTPDDLDTKSVVYRPSTWAIGNKAKVGDLDVGDVVQAGAGAKIRPYVVEAKFHNKVFLRNLESGDIVPVTKNKQYARLLPASDPSSSIPKPGEVAPPASSLGPQPVSVGQKPMSELAAGDMFSHPSGGYWTVVEKLGDGGFTAYLTGAGADDEGKTVTFPKALAEQATKPADLVAFPDEAKLAAKPELAGKFDESKFVKGEKAKLKDLAPGDVFLSATGLPMQLKSTAPKGGGTAIALHNGKLVKNISYEKDFTTLVAKDEVPFDYANLSVGDKVPLSQLEVGDKFKMGFGTYVKTEDGIASLNDAGELTAKMKTSALGDSDPEMVYLGKHSDDAPDAPAPAPMPDLDPSAYPGLGSGQYFSYMHAKSGKHKYPTISTMPEGTVFTDKAGKAWKVKKSGGTPVISDGETLWSVNGSWRGKISDGSVAFSESESAPVEAPSESAVTVGDLAVGDSFVVPEGYHGAGTEYQVLDTTPIQKDGYTTFKVSKVSGGGPEEISTTLPPAKVTKATPVAKPAKPPKVPEGFAPMGEAMPANSSAFNSFDLAVTPAGKVVYRTKGSALDPNPVWYTLGTGKKSQAGKLTPVAWTGPQARSMADLEPTGEQTPIIDVPVGGFFGFGGSTYQVIGATAAGHHSRKVGSDQIYWTSATVQAAKQLAPTFKLASAEEKAKAEAGLPPTLTAVQVSWLPEGTEVWTLGGQKATKHHNSAGAATLKLEDGTEVEAKSPVYESDPYEWGSNAPAGPPLQIVDLQSTGGLAVGERFTYQGDTFEVTGTDEYTVAVKDVGTGGEYEINFDMGGHATGMEPASPEEPPATPKPTKPIPVKHVSQMEVGDTYTANADGHFYKWKVVQHSGEGSGASANIELVDTDDPAEKVGQQGQIDGPISVSVTRDSGVTAGLYQPGDKVEEKPSYSVPGVNADQPAPKDDGWQPGTNFGAVNVGDHVELNNGDQYVVTNKGSQAGWLQPIGSTSGHLEGTAKQMWFASPIKRVLPTPAHEPYAWQPGDLIRDKSGHEAEVTAAGGSSGVWHLKHVGGDSDGKTFSLARPALVDTYGYQRVSNAVGSVENPLKPYLHPKSGKYKYEKISELKAGTAFTDKAGGKYRVVGHTGDQTIYEDKHTGKQFSTDGKSRVKVTSTIKVQEGRMVMTTAGRYLLTA
jgi:hypothetical protein